MNNSGPHWYKNIPIANWHLKLLALVLALLTFYAIRGETGFEMPFDVPLEVDVERGVAILDQPKTVQVTFRGSQSELRNLDPRQLRVRTRAKASETAGTETILLRPDNVVGTAGIHVTGIDPKVVVIGFDREEEKMFRVLKPRTVGVPLAGKVEIDYEPQYVRITGPKRWLKDREVVEVEPVDVGGAVQSFTRRMRVIPPAATAVMRIEPPEVTVKVSMATESVIREFPVVPVLAIQRAGESVVVRFSPSEVAVTLHGRDEVLKKIAGDDVKALVNCEGLDTGVAYDLPVSVQLPVGVDVTATVEPKQVKVTFDPGTSGSK